jgi:hypothetical protein
MTSISIMQPTYLPWPGYFNLIHKSDIFIFLSGVKFEKSSWHHRNYFLISGNKTALTVPIKGSRLQSIKEVEINEQTSWRKKHINSLFYNYKNHDYGKDILDLIIPIIESKEIIMIEELNITLIKTICEYLGISVTFSTDRKINQNIDKSTRLIEICNKHKSNLYYSPFGSKKYIENERLFEKTNIQIKYQSPKSICYNQRTLNDFIPYLSVVDLIANLGSNKSLEYINKSF